MLAVAWQCVVWQIFSHCWIVTVHCGMPYTCAERSILHNMFLKFGLWVGRRRSMEVNQTLYHVWSSPGLAHYIYIFGGSCPPMEFCQVQNLLCIQVLCSPILAALLHGTRPVGISQSLRHGTRNGITELLQRAPPIFGRAAITLGIGPHSSYYMLLLLCCVCGILRLENNLLVQVELPPSDLGATGLLNKSLQLLQEILSSHDSSSVTPEERKQAVAQVKTVCHCCADDSVNTSCITSQKFI